MANVKVVWVTSLVLVLVPATLFGGTITITAGNGSGAVGQHIPVSIDVTALNLGGAVGIDGVTLNFGAKDPLLEVGAFAPGPLLAGWIDATNRPPFPTYGWSYVTFGGGFTATGSLGTLDVWSNTVGVYTLAFDVTTAGVATEAAGGGQAFTLTTQPGTITVPEPTSLALVAVGLCAVMRRRWRRCG